MEKNKKTILLFLVLMFVMPSFAKTAKEAWVAMPDSMISYLTKNQRMELVDLIDMKVEPQVNNELHGVTAVDTLTNNYLKVNLNKASIFELKVLTMGTDTLLCVVRTYLAPEKESEVTFYDTNWNVKNISYTVPTLVHKPDTMSQEKYDDLYKMIEPEMIYAELSPSDNTITYSLSTPLLNKEDKEAIKPILLQRKLKWDGGIFKEY